MPSPTRTPVLSASVGLTGVPGGCGGYTKTEELLLNLVLSSHIQGNASFSNHTCEDEDERRMLSNPAVALTRRLDVSTNPVMLAIEISVTTASVTDDDSTSAAQAVGSLLSAAQSSGALASTIMSMAAAANVSSLSSVSVHHISTGTFSPTPAPTSFRSSAPTGAPISTTTPARQADSEPKRFWKIIAAVVLVVLVVLCLGGMLVPLFATTAAGAKKTVANEGQTNEPSIEEADVHLRVDRYPGPRPREAIVHEVSIETLADRSDKGILHVYDFTWKDQEGTGSFDCAADAARVGRDAKQGCEDTDMFECGCTGDGTIFTNGPTSQDEVQNGVEPTLSAVAKVEELVPSIDFDDFYAPGAQSSASFSAGSFSAEV